MLAWLLPLLLLTSNPSLLGSVNNYFPCLPKSTKKCKLKNVLTNFNKWGGVKCELMFNFASDCRLISVLKWRPATKLTKN